MGGALRAPPTSSQTLKHYLRGIVCLKTIYLCVKILSESFLKMSKFTSILIIVLLVTIINPVSFLRAQTDDKEAPLISDVKIDKVSDTEFKITWKTNEPADSLVNFSLQPNYGTIRVPTADKTEHEVTINNLEPGKVYYFRVASADENGNQSISADYRLNTDTAQDNPQDTSNSSNPETVSTESLIEAINQITNPQQLQEILNETVKAIQGVTEDLTIVGPPTVIPESTTATIKWTTDRPATSEVLFSPLIGFDGNNYEFSQQSTGEAVTEHEVKLIGLDPFTEYNFKVVSSDEFNIVGESKNFTFKTKAVAPGIRNLKIVKVEENSATLAWNTTVPTKALVEYQDQTTGKQNSVGRPTFTTSHQMRLSDLTLGTRYVAFVIAENSSGDRVRSQPIQFITVKDVLPPIISNVTNESTLFPGSEARVQTIIEWDTDEPADCLLTYQEGIADGAESHTLKKEKKSYVTEHVEVTVDLSPATVYQFYLTCSDESGNERRSENFVLFTPAQEKNIIDLIIENFEATFGWLKNIKGG